MKAILKTIITSILIILPIILIILFIFYLKLYRNAVPVTSENIEIFNYLFEINDVGIKIDENVKEIAMVSSNALAYSRYEVVYKNGEVKRFSNEIIRQDKAKNDSKLSSYIKENDSNPINFGTGIIIFIVSVIISIYLIFQSPKIIYED